jgi:hypothetical protein
VCVEECLEGFLPIPEGLGVPLNADHEAPGRHLDGLDHAVAGAVSRDLETVAEPIDRLMVEAVHAYRVPSQDRAQRRVWGKLDVV